MLRRLIAILLTFAVPLQGLAVTHSHAAVGGSQPNGHRERPHFHFGGNHHHQHVGHHRHLGQHPHRHDADADHAASQPTPSPATAVPANGHDHDAVYVVDEFGLNPVASPQPDFGVLVATLWVAAEPSISSGFPRAVDAVARPPSWSGVPLYLLALTLLL